MKTPPPLEHPLTIEQMRVQADEEYYIEGVVKLDLDEVVDWDGESFLDNLSERLTGTLMLGCIDYEVVGHEGDELHVKVTGEVASILEVEDEATEGMPIPRDDAAAED